MRCSLRNIVRSAAMLALLVLGGADWAAAGALDPLNPSFPSLGEFPSTPGTYTYNFIGGIPTLGGPGGSLTGVLYTDAPGHQIAVFDFNSINLGSAQSLLGPNPLFTDSAPALALLSRGDVTINGSIDVGAPHPVTPPIFSPGGPGGFGSGGGPGAGGGGG